MQLPKYNWLVSWGWDLFPGRDWPPSTPHAASGKRKLSPNTPAENWMHSRSHSLPELSTHRERSDDTRTREDEFIYNVLILHEVGSSFTIRLLNTILQAKGSVTSNSQAWRREEYCKEELRNVCIICYRLGRRRKRRPYSLTLLFWSQGDPSPGSRRRNPHPTGKSCMHSQP